MKGKNEQIIDEKNKRKEKQNKHEKMNKRKDGKSK